MKLLKKELDNGIMLWKLNRPEAKNAVDFEVIHLFEEYLEELENREDIRMLIICGGEGAFCSGGDLQAFHGLRTAAEAETMLLPMNRVLQRIIGLACPVITYLEGPAVGGGAELASAGDLIYVSSDASMGFIQGRLALTTGWGGAALISEKIGRASALKLLGSAERLKADSLIYAGIADGKAESLEDLLKEIHWPVPAGVLKTYKSHLKNSKALQQQMAQEAYYCAEQWESQEHHEAVEKFLAGKRSQ